MKLNLMRKIDFWAGIPLCFLFSFFCACQRLFKLHKPVRTPIKKILLIKLSEMGAASLAYPLLAKLKWRYPEAELYFLVFKKNASALKLMGGIIQEKNIYGIEEESAIRMLITTFSALKELRRQKVDVVIDLEFFSRFTAILAYLSGGPKRVGFYRYFLEGLYRGELLTHKIEYNSSIHCSHAYLALGESLENDCKDTPEFKAPVDNQDLKIPKFSSTPDGQNQVREKLKAHGYQSGQRLFLVNPGEGVLPLREWPLENFLELSRRILEDPNNMIVLVGCSSVSEKDKTLHKKLNHPRCINLMDQTTLNEILEIFCIADVLIANDSGLVHLASLTPIRKFVFFGPGDPKVWGPLGHHSHIIYSHLPCSPCLTVLNHRNSTCQDNQCLKVISVDYVHNLLRQDN